MKPVTKCTDAELEFAIGDCRTAIQANPSMQSLVKYGQEITACEREQAQRARIRNYRHSLRQGLYDILTTPVRSRRWRYTDFTAFRRDQWRTAAIFLGYYRLYEQGRWVNAAQ